MALTRDQMDRKLDEHFGYEARDDIDGVIATLDENVEHDIVGWPPGPSHGRDQARAFYEATFADLGDGSVRSLRRLYGDNFMVDDSIWTGVAKGRPFGLSDWHDWLHTQTLIREAEGVLMEKAGDKKP